MTSGTPISAYEPLKLQFCALLHLAFSENLFEASQVGCGMLAMLSLEILLIVVIPLTNWFVRKF